MDKAFVSQCGRIYKWSESESGQDLIRKSGNWLAKALDVMGTVIELHVCPGVSINVTDHQNGEKGPQQ